MVNRHEEIHTAVFLRTDGKMPCGWEPGIMRGLSDMAQEAGADHLGQIAPDRRAAGYIRQIGYIRITDFDSKQTLFQSVFSGMNIALHFFRKRYI